MKGLLSLPDLNCLKKTGPFDSIFINIANKGKAQLKMKKIINNENPTSNARLRNLLSTFSCGSGLTDITGMCPKLWYSSGFIPKL